MQLNVFIIDQINLDSERQTWARSGSSVANTTCCSVKYDGSENPNWLLTTSNNSDSRRFDMFFWPL